MWKRKRRARRGAPSVVRSRRFEVVDGEGRVRAVLGETTSVWAAKPALGLELLDAAGHPRLAVLLTSFGPSLTVSAAGNIVAALGHDDPHAEVEGAGAFLQLMTADGAPAALWWVEADGRIREEFGHSR